MVGIAASQSWQRSVFVIGLVVSILLVWGSGALYQYSQQRFRYQTEHELLVVNQVQRNILQRWRESYITDAVLLADDGFFSRAVVHWQHSGDQGTGADLQRRLSVMQEQKNYDAVYLVDTQGRFLLSALGPAQGMLPAVETRHLSEVLKRVAPVVIEPRRDAAFTFPFFSVLVPLHDGVNVVGVVWLVVDVRASLYPLLNSWLSNSATVESLIVMQSGDDVLFVSPLRYGMQAPLTLRESLSMQESPAVQAVMGKEGVFYSQDYRGEQVVAVASHVVGSPWYLLSKVDRKEAFSNEWRKLLIMIVPVVFGVFCASLALIYWQRQAWHREHTLASQLKRTLHWLEQAQKTASIGYFSYNFDKREFSLSEITGAIFGFRSSRPVPLKRWLRCIHRYDRAYVLDAYRQTLAQRSRFRVQCRLFRENDAQTRWVEVWAEYEVDHDNTHMVRLIGTMQDITERKKTEEALLLTRQALETQVRRDSLTQVANRLALDERLQAEWGRAARLDSPLSVLMIDVDHFKDFNDHYGHVAGDQCLRDVARIISSRVMRSTDMVARYGGEEFVVLLPETTEENACHLAEEIVVAVRDAGLEHCFSPHDGRVTVSVGVVCVYPFSEEPVKDIDAATRFLLECADMAMYTAKKSGRNRVAVYLHTADQKA